MAEVWPERVMDGRGMEDPYAEAQREVTASPQRRTTSPALQRRKTSPTNSVEGSMVEVLDEGKCQGELKVSVNARCCSAITRREIRWTC